MKTKWNYAILVGLVIAVGLTSSHAAEHPATRGDAAKPNRSARPELADLKYGVFIHHAYITPDADIRGSGEQEAKGGFGVREADRARIKDVNDWAAATDIEGVFDVLAKARAQYVIWTAYHAGGNPLYPSKVTARWRGKNVPSAILKHDMLDAVLTAGEKRGITVLFYVHGGTHAIEGVDLKSGFDLGGYKTELAAEISARYPNRIFGVYIDHCNEGGYGLAFCQALRSHNPDMYLGCKGGKVALEGTFLANEKKPFSTHLFNMKKKDRNYRWVGASEDPTTVDEVRPYGSATPMLGSFWWIRQQRKDFSSSLHANQMVRYLMHCASVSEYMGLTFATGIYVGDPPYFEPQVGENLIATGQMLEPIQEALFGTRPDTAWPNKDALPIRDLPWGGSATMAKDKSATYVNLFKRPEGDVLRLPPPQDGASFTAATLLNAGGGEVKLDQTAEGIILRLPEGMQWDPVVTVVKLTRAANDVQDQPHDQ